MSKYRKKKKVPIGFLVLLVVLALLFVLPACTSFFTATGGGGTSSGGNPPSGGVVTPPSGDDTGTDDGTGDIGTVEPPTTDEDGNCLHTVTKPVGTYFSEYNCVQNYACAICDVQVGGGAGMAPHVYTDMVCIFCGYSCKHPGMTDGGTCEYCGYGCAHSSTTYSKAVSAGIYTHDVYNTCTACGFNVISADEKCTFVDGVCSMCENRCPHSSCVISYDSLNETQHTQLEYCRYCGYEIGVLTYAHIFEDGKCYTCGHTCIHNWTDGTCVYCSMICSHAKTYTYSNAGGYSYTVSCLCGKSNASGTDVQDTQYVFFGSGNAQAISVTYAIGMTWSDLLSNGGQDYLGTTVLIDNVQVVSCSYGGSQFVMLDGDYVRLNDYIRVDAKYVTDTYS